MISVCILTKNSEATLKCTLDSVQEFEEILIFDTGSTDKTIAIAEKYPNVKIHTTEFTGFGQLRNQLASYAKNNWILSIDSDEILSKSLVKEILSVSLDESVAYTIPRKNFLNKKWIKGCGWYPDRVARLYNKKSTSWSDAQVHESLKARKQISLKSPIYHTPYRSTEEFLAKMQHYSTLFAKQYEGKKKSSFKKALGHALFAFLRSYIIKRGFLDGSEGFIISLYNANTAFYKYMKLKELS